MSDKNKPLEIAKSVEKKVRKMVDEMFALAEVDKAKDATKYFEVSNNIFAAVIAAAAQRMLDDGLMTGRLHDKIHAGTSLARELFLSNHPEIVAKIVEEKKIKQAQAMLEEQEADEDVSDEDESDNDE